MCEKQAKDFLLYHCMCCYVSEILVVFFTLVVFFKSIEAVFAWILKSIIAKDTMYNFQATTENSSLSTLLDYLLKKKKKMNFHFFKIFIFLFLFLSFPC